MTNKSSLAERTENVAFEAVPTGDINPRTFGSIAMPEDAKARYHREINSNQLVLPHYAYPESTVEMDEHGRDLLV